MNPMPRLRFALALTCLTLLAACAHGPEPVTLRPPPQPFASDAGRGLPVTVQVTDARPGDSATDLPSAVRARAEYPVQGDPVETIRQGVIAGLRRQGFVPGAGGGPSLDVELRRFDYWVLKGIGTSDVRATAVLYAVAHRGGATFEVTYKADQHQKVAIFPRRQDVEEAVNGALATVLKQLFADNQLKDFLTRE
jgi:uncharacterized lipoprotein